MTQINSSLHVIASYILQKRKSDSKKNEYAVLTGFLVKYKIDGFERASKLFISGLYHPTSIFSRSPWKPLGQSKPGIIIFMESLWTWGMDICLRGGDHMTINAVMSIYG